MPDAPTALRGQMDVRIARKVAALTGIAGSAEDSPDAGRGRRWFTDYRALTTTELSLGGPVRATRPPADEGGVVDAGLFRRAGSTVSPIDGAGPAPLPSVTLQEYGPDTKAALVLTGVNRVLRPVTAAVTEAIDDLRKRIDDECLLVAVTQALVQEVFEAQPVLLVHGVQAAMIQRALLLSETVQSRIDTGAGPVPVARIEHGWPAGVPGQHRPDQVPHQPDQVTLLWQVWDMVVASGAEPSADEPRKSGAEVAFRRLAGYEQDHAFLVTNGADAREEWVAILRGLSESHLLGTSPGLPPSPVRILRHGADAQAVAVIARERQIELMLARLAPRLVPLHDPEGGPREVELPAFEPERWGDAGTLTRRAALLAQFYCIRAAGWLAGMTDLDRRRDRFRCATRYRQLAEAAAVLLEPDDPLRVQLDAQGRAYALQYQACLGQLDHAAYRRIVADLDQLVGFAEVGRYSPAQLVEQLQIVLVELGTYRFAREWFAADAPQVLADITADLRRLWQTARSVHGRLVADVDGADLSYLDHNYAGFLISDPARGPDVAEGVRILLDEVIPAREATARREGRSRGLRLSRQVLLRGLRTALEAGLGAPAVRSTWAVTALDLAAQLETDPDARDLIAQRNPVHRSDGFDNSVLILLLRIAEGRVAAVTSGALPSVADADVRRTDRAVRLVEHYAGGWTDRGVVDAATADALRVLQVRELGRRWRTWRTGAAGAVNGPPIPATGTPTAPPAATP